MRKKLRLAGHRSRYRLRKQVVEPVFGHMKEGLAMRRMLMRGIKKVRHERAMACTALEQEPPLCWWRDFRLSGGKEFPHTLDLKGQGIRIFVDVVRIYALAHGIEPTNTVERLRSVRPALGMPVEEVAAMAAAFYQIQRLRLQNQVSGEFPGATNRINPDRLHKLDRQILKEAFRLARTLQQRLRQDYLS